MSPKKLLFSAAVLSLPVIPAYAQADPTVDRRSMDDFHGSQEIIVTAPYIEQLDILAGTSVLSGDALTRNLRGQIGDTLTSLPGVSATSFTPGSSRPVLRGFQGPRVKVLTDGIGTLDAAASSVDHAVTIDPLTTQRVEVLRGPAVLLFGGDAIGGAVNAIDKRIPRAVPQEPIHIDALAGFGSAADDWSIAGSVDVPLTSKLVVHVDGSYRETDDLRIPGFVLSPALRAEVLEEAAEEFDEGEFEEAEELTETANQRDRIPNTGTETYSVGAGLAFIGDGGNLGFSVGYYNSDYGIPARPGAEHHHEEDDGGAGGAVEEEEEEGPVTIGLEQFRADLRGGVNLGSGFFESFNFRVGYSDYEHTEFEGDEIGTVFTVEGIEARAYLTQAERNGWRGVIGTQFLARDFNAVGAEAFVPKNSTESWAIFTVQEVDLGDFELEGSLRFDHTSVRLIQDGRDLSELIDNLGPSIVNFDRSFNAFSAALGFAYAPDDSNYKIGANISRAERAPSAEELLSGLGPHIATQAFEIGNPNFTTEKSWGGELYARWNTDDVNLSATVYANFFDDFIFDLETGAEEDDLPVFQYFQRDATYYGVEVAASARLASAGGFDFIANGVADYVHAEFDNGGGPVPRIPPLRLLGGLAAQSTYFDVRAEVEWADNQNRVTTFETPTDGFTMVNASLAWRPMGPEGGITLLASANNIFDVNARRHASFTKDFVPLAGRDFRVGAKFSF